MNNSKEKLFEELQWKNKSKKKMVFHKKKKIVETESEEIQRLINNYKNIESSKIKVFKDFPISRKTLEGLKNAGYNEPTDIQRESIGLALRGLDILGAAQTGSGKTLAFIIPVLESLFTKLWSKCDGLGGIIITPTRELAYQIFETLKKVGCKHDFSAGLIIGGKDLKFERKRMDKVNIIICTPGRLLQHMDENPMFNCSQLQVLVLDEADRCLDMGFETTMNAIIANFPKDRQTLLFSATQTKSVKDLARLSLKSPAYVSVHENSQFSTPEKLQQSYIVCPVESKMDMLWSFIKHHKKSKILVFLSSCKQVRFVYMLFCRMRPGITILALYGTLHQLKRMKVYEEFCQKQSVVLFATDIASRGLDFPEVDWVVQFDCPEDATTYIHRVGRTARYNQKGEALLVLSPSEEQEMISQLEEKKIPIDKIEVNPSRQMSVRRKFDALLARDPNLKECAQRAFKSYLKSIFLMKNKEVFDVSKIDLSAFASSLGLAVAPRVRFLQKKFGKTSFNTGEMKEETASDEEADTSISTEHYSKSASKFDFSVDDEEEDDLKDLFVGKKEPKLESEEDVSDIIQETSSKSKKTKTKAKLAKKLIKKHITINNHVNFDEEGEQITDLTRQRQSDLAKNYETEDASGIDIEKAKEILKLEDKYDRQIFRERIREKHRAKRQKEKLKRKKTDQVESVAIAGSDEDSDAPNVDWLPDPDKLYGPSGSDDESEAMNTKGIEEMSSLNNSKRLITNTDDSDSDEEHITTDKRRWKKKSKIDAESLDQGIMEEFALNLLRN